MVQIIVIFLLCFICGVVQSAIGFGSVIIMMAVMPLFLPAGVCVILAQISGTVLSFWMLRDLWRSIEWKKVWVPMLFAVGFGIVGLFLAKGISDAIYMKILGALLVLLSLWMLVFSTRVRIRPSIRNGSIVGLVSGVLGALFAVSAPPLVLYYSASTEDKDNYTACLQITLGLQGLITLIGRGVFGMWSEGVWLLCVPAVVGMLLGSIPKACGCCVCRRSSACCSAASRERKSTASWTSRPSRCSSTSSSACSAFTFSSATENIKKQSTAESVFRGAFLCAVICASFCL